MFVQTNELDGNRIVVFEREADGRLDREDTLDNAIPYSREASVVSIRTGERGAVSLPAAGRELSASTQGVGHPGMRHH